MKFTSRRRGTSTLSSPSTEKRPSCPKPLFSPNILRGRSPARLKTMANFSSAVGAVTHERQLIQRSSCGRTSIEGTTTSTRWSRGFRARPRPLGRGKETSHMTKLVLGLMYLPDQEDKLSRANSRHRRSRTSMVAPKHQERNENFNKPRPQPPNLSNVLPKNS